MRSTVQRGMVSAMRAASSRFTTLLWLPYWSSVGVAMDFTTLHKSTAVRPRPAPLEKAGIVFPGVAPVAGPAQAVAHAFFDEGSRSARHQALEMGERSLGGIEIPRRSPGVIGHLAAQRQPPGAPG